MKSRRLHLFMDVDGVLIRSHSGPDVTRRRSWDEALRTSVGIDPDKLSETFFAKRFGSVLLGRVDLLEALREAILEMGETADPKDIVRCWFEAESELDQTLLLSIRSLTRGGLVEAYIATNQEKYRLHHLWETLRPKDFFLDKFWSGNIAAFKVQPEFYEHVHRALKLDPHQEDILFFDDMIENVAAAKCAGWSAHLYSGIDDFIHHERISSMLTAARSESQSGRQG